MTPVPLVERIYTPEELIDLRRTTLRYARAFPPGSERDRHRQVAASLRLLFRRDNWILVHTTKVS
jgi:hypothetical protein